MVVQSLPALDGSQVELDLCYACQGMWLDPQENLKLSPAAVAQLFKLLHAHRDVTRLPLANTTSCPHCKSALTHGFDVVRTGRYITYRCPNRHGRFSAFSSFMIEKGFVRLLTKAEIDTMALRVGVIHCTGCGAPVDLRKDHACPHCRSAFSLLDPGAVEKALQGYAKAAHGATGSRAPDLADALVALERDRQRTLREASSQQGGLLYKNVPDVDLWALGIDLVRKILD
jgi:Zn-finger nucleic acid-binding protein